MTDRHKYTGLLLLALFALQYLASEDRARRAEAMQLSFNLEQRAMLRWWVGGR